MSAIRSSYLLESCLLCDRLAPERFSILRAPDRFGNERAPAQQRMAPICARCLALLQRAGARGLVETESGARWTLAAAVTAAAAALPAAPPAP